MPEDNKINIIAVFIFTNFLDVILRTETININITPVGNGEDCIIRSLMFYVYHLLILSNNALNTGVKYEI